MKIFVEDPNSSPGNHLIWNPQSYAIRFTMSWWCLLKHGCFIHMDLSKNDVPPNLVVSLLIMATVPTGIGSTTIAMDTTHMKHLPSVTTHNPPWHQLAPHLGAVLPGNPPELWRVPAVDFHQPPGIRRLGRSEETKQPTAPPSLRFLKRRFPHSSGLVLGIQCRGTQRWDCSPMYANRQGPKNQLANGAHRWSSSDSCARDTCVHQSQPSAKSVLVALFYVGGAPFSSLFWATVAPQKWGCSLQLVVPYWKMIKQKWWFGGTHPDIFRSMFLALVGFAPSVTIPRQQYVIRYIIAYERIANHNRQRYKYSVL